jgi:hypothetical protein
VPDSEKREGELREQSDEEQDSAGNLIKGKGGPAIPGLQVFERPVEGEWYVIGADPADGNSQSDASADEDAAVRPGCGAAAGGGGAGARYGDAAAGRGP